MILFKRKNKFTSSSSYLVLHKTSNTVRGALFRIRWDIEPTEIRYTKLGFNIGELLQEYSKPGYEVFEVVKWFT